MVLVACWEWNWLATNREQPCKWQHSPQFQDRSPDADSSGLPNTVEDADVEDSALENSLASSYWFGAWAWAEETWTVMRQTRGITCTTKRIPNENYRNLNVQSVPSAALVVSTSFRPPLLRLFNVVLAGLYPVKAWIQRRCCEKHEAAREVVIKIERNGTMLQFASFDTSLWKVPSLIPKIQISQPQLFKRHLPIFHIEVCWKFQEIWPTVTGSTENNPPKENPEYLFLLENAIKPWSWVFFGIRSHSIFDRIYDTYPSQGPPEISNDLAPRGNIQAATFKPLAPPQFLTVLISWLLNREKESPKKHEQPQKRGQICEKLGSLRHV